MRIYLLIENITRTGGTERAGVGVANMLSSLGHEVSFISLLSKNGDSIYFDLSRKVDIVHLALPHLQKSIWRKAMWYAQALHSLYKKALQEESILIGFGHNVNIMLPLVKRFHNAKATIGCEHIDFETIPSIFRRIIGKIYPRLSQVVVLSETARHKVFKATHTSNISVIPNALPFGLEKQSNANSLQILLVGRLCEEKCFDKVISISKHLIHKYPTIHFDIYGEGPEKEKLQHLISSTEQTDYITIHPFVKDIHQIYLHHGLLLITSRTEAMPMVVLEAGACGLPTIALPNEGTRLLVKDNINGYIANNEEEAAIRISQLADDVNLLNHLRKGAKSEAERYTPQAVLQYWNKLINQFSQC